MYRSKAETFSIQFWNRALKTMPLPSERRVAVKSREMVAITTPMVASLAVRVRKITRVWPRYFLPGCFSKNAGTPEAKLRKKP